MVARYGRAESPRALIAYARAVPADVKRVCLLGAESTGK
jgi:hypothetical protein